MSTYPMSSRESLPKSPEKEKEQDDEFDDASSIDEDVKDDHTKDDDLDDEDFKEEEETPPPTPPATEPEPTRAPPPYSVYPHKQKLFIIGMAALAAVVSPLTANIYYPAIPNLANVFGVTIDQINLSITIYLIFQGLAPAFTGSVSDNYGRRSAYIVCFVVYLAANLGLALQSSYAGLLVLRAVQSSGSSGTIALGNAVVSDLFTSAERGSYISLVSAGSMLGLAFGPVIGGALNLAGWRWIFWFLVILSGTIFVAVLFFMPETCRNLVGNGSIPVGKWNQTFLSYFQQRRLAKKGIEVEKVEHTQRSGGIQPLGAFKLFAEIESGLVLLYAGLTFAGFYMVVASLPIQLKNVYGLKSLQIGACYFATGFGSLAAALSIGKVLNWNFSRYARKMNLSVDANAQQNLQDFPIERTRLDIVIPLQFCAAGGIIGYGWTVSYDEPLVAPLLFLFVASYGISGIFQALSTLLVDLNRDKPGTATASLNLSRCWLGAIGTALVQALTRAIGIGWTGVVIAGISTVGFPIVFIAIKFGPEWREKKRIRLQRQNELTVA